MKLNISYHPQTDVQAKRIIQTLEDILRAYMLVYKGNWDDHLPLIELPTITVLMLALR